MNRNLTNLSKWMLPFCLILFLANCGNNETPIKSNHLLEIALNYYGMDETPGWEPFNELTSGFLESLESGTTFDEVYLAFKKEKPDTIYSLYFFISFFEKDTFFIPRFLYQRFYCDFFQHIVLFGENKDTLFHYKAELFGSLHKTFLSGKYYYQYFFNALQPEQRRFFELHMDSLTKEKGNHLPHLPNEN